MPIFWIAMAILGGGLVLLVANHDAGSVFGIENEDFGNLVWASALVLVLSAAFVGSRRRHLGGAARSIALWLAILLALVAGYQYRYELQDIASRLTAGLVPASPISMTLDGANAVRVDRLDSGHFEVRGEVNGAAVRFVVDTGATATVLTTRDAERVGFDLAELSFDIPVSTANGMARAARVVADTLSVGAISRERVTILVAEEGRLGQSLLGMNFISTLSGFEVRGDRMLLHD